MKWGGPFYVRGRGNLTPVCALSSQNHFNRTANERSESLAMPIANPKYVSELNELAQRCTDSAGAYRRALLSVDSGRLAAFCKRRAQDREKLAGQLRIRVKEYGESPHEGGTVSGAAEKVLGEAKSLVMDDEDAILSELVAVEEALKEFCERYAEATASDSENYDISEDYAEITKSCAMLKELKDGAEA